MLDPSEPHPSPSGIVSTECRDLVVILGAGRDRHRPLPPALLHIHGRTRVLDWLLDAFSCLDERRVCFVGGYRHEEVATRYPDLHLLINPDWELTGPAHSLAQAPVGDAERCWVCYADVVFRPEIVARMDAVDADLVVAIDSRWRERYDGRSAADIAAAEKLDCRGGRLDAVGVDVDLEDATAEFCGLLRMSRRAAEQFQAAQVSGELRSRSTLPDLLRVLRRSGIDAALVDVAGDWAELNAPQDLARFVLGTKAESLERLRPLVTQSTIGRQVTFTRGEWQTDAEQIIDCIRSEFLPDDVIVRSSSRAEDSWHSSQAGAFVSVLGVPTAAGDKLSAAVERVLDSYPGDAVDEQVLVQQMLATPVLSGVAVTRTVEGGAPYIVLNVDDTSQRTDTVTAGDGATLRTVFVHRELHAPGTLSTELESVLTAVREIESLVGHDCLDLEFAVTADHAVHILQVRPLAAAHGWPAVDDERVQRCLEQAMEVVTERTRPSPFLVGSSTLFSNMSDWNPAEIIGTQPNRLALSLYQQLVTNEIWALQRSEYGYRDVRPRNLLVELVGHPFVDVRATFNSFVPADLPRALAERLVEHSLARLAAAPELHDKVEFEILLTCYTFDFEERAARLLGADFTDADLTLLKTALSDLTARGIARLPDDRAALDTLSRRLEVIHDHALPPLERAYLLLDDARRLGALPFAHLARNGFVAVSLLRSLHARDLLDDADVASFHRALCTVSADLTTDAAAVRAGTLTFEELVARYGHLRPGTYDITAPTYASAPEEYLRPYVEHAPEAPDDSAHDGACPWSDRTVQAVSDALATAGLGVEFPEFWHFLTGAIEGRELGKFLFSRNLSRALESLADYGASQGFSREDLAHVRIADLLELRMAGCSVARDALDQRVRSGRDAHAATRAVMLPPVITSAADLRAFEQHRATPNFITSERARGPCVQVAAGSSPELDVADKIVLIVNADPGFDWLFGRNPAALITMYGGANSHMAIRAAERQLPAVIGAGPQLYAELTQARWIELDCAARRVEGVR